MIRGTRLGALFVLLCGFVGCADLSGLQTRERWARGYVILLPGAGGGGVGPMAGIAKGLSEAGVPYAMETDDWTTGCPLLAVYHLRALERNRSHARRIAGKVQSYRKQHPGYPVWIIAHSTGAAVALFTLEALPKDVSVEGAILLGAAVSPEYDLAPALRHAQRGVWAFYSNYDIVILGLGTAVFGTADGEHRPSAGMVGFEEPKGADPKRRVLYEAKLRERSYSVRMLRDVHLGGHFGWLVPSFAKRRLAPIMLDRRKRLPIPAPSPANTSSTRPRR